ncbi:unnamed protein product [Hyaloperonospora brassicae]|uniref:Amino acid transporter n=1 Tax=Hyaloperonospora brassicae TaxID=162125 RepID=A0AAV0V206_HYABA|nr:unnamed protein product [Hyaloperonospora brassicae]
MPSPTPPLKDVVGSLSCVALPRLLLLFLGVSCGASLALAVALAGVRSSALVQWLLRAPGDLLLQALAGLTLPLVALHATRTGSQLQTRQLPILWTRLALATPAASMTAAMVPVLWALCWPQHCMASFRVARLWRSESVTLQSIGSLVCSANATAFMIDDVAHTFVAGAVTQKARSVSEQVVTMVENAFPESAADAVVDGNVHGVMVGEFESKEELMILQLVKQAEAAGCRLLSWLQTHLSIGVIFMVSSVLPRPSVPKPIADSEEGFTDLALVTVLLLALVLGVVVMMVLATLFFRFNPFAFFEHLLPAQLLALSSGSSVVALPATVSAIVANKRVSP